jgi:glycosyltransferase involved in cell wall biosynthesis
LNSPKLSVTISSYNYARYIGQTIESILSQSFKDFELIIVDDCSTDNSVEVIQKYVTQDNRVCLVTHDKNAGYIATSSEANNLARGIYLVHIDSDDWIVDSNAFEKQVSFMDQHPDLAFVYSPLAHYDDDGNCYMVRHAAETDAVNPGEVEIFKVFERLVPHSGTMYRASAYQASGGYDPSYDYAVDLKLWVDLCEQGNVGYINQVLYAYRQHSTSMSRFAKLRLWQEEILRAIDSTFNGPIAQRVPNASKMRKEVTKVMLMANPIHDVFSNRYLRGWQAYWISLQMKPIETLIQKNSLVMLLRTILGDKGFNRVRAVYIKFRSKKQLSQAQPGQS